jgi:thymidylate kinase
MYKSKTECLNLFFSFLNNNGILYSVIGDTRELPDIVPSDIDIVVSYDAFKKINYIVKQFTTKFECNLVQILQHESTSAYFVVSFVGHNNKIEYIKPDICSDYYRNGKPFIRANELLENIKIATTESGRQKSFYVCSPEVEFSYYLIKKIDKGILNKQQFEHLLQQYEQAQQKCKAKLLTYWLSEEVNTIIKALECADFEKLKASLPHLKNQLSKNTTVTFKDRYNEFQRKLYRILNPTGMFLVFLGPDGAGKTAIGQCLEHELAPVFRGVQRFHLRPSLLGKKGKENIAVTNPHGKPVRSIFSSLVKLVYFFCDYLLGFVVKVLPLKIKSQLIIFDRYYHDLLIDPKRYRYGASMMFAKIVSWLIPKPDLFIVLDAPAEVIQARKQEVPLEETQRQRTAYLKFAREQSNCIVLDTSVGIEETVKQGSEQILAFMKERQMRRLHKK